MALFYSDEDDLAILAAMRACSATDSGPLVDCAKALGRTLRAVKDRVGLLRARGHLAPYVPPRAEIGEPRDEDDDGAFWRSVSRRCAAHLADLQREYRVSQ